MRCVREGKLKIRIAKIKGDDGYSSSVPYTAGVNLLLSKKKSCNFISS